MDDLDRERAKQAPGLGDYGAEDQAYGGRDDEAVDDVEGPATGTAAAAAAGTSGGPAVVGGLGAGVFGAMAADELVDDEGAVAEPDHESSADSFAGGDSSGEDTALSDRDQPS